MHCLLEQYRNAFDSWEDINFDSTLSGKATIARYCVHQKWFETFLWYQSRNAVVKLFWGEVALAVHHYSLGISIWPKFDITLFKNPESLLQQRWINLRKFFHLQKNVPNHYPILSTVYLKIICLRQWFGKFLWRWSQREKLSEIKGPLVCSVKLLSVVVVKEL